MHIVVSDSAAARLDAARQFVLARPAGLGSPDRLGVARRGRRLRAPVARGRGATFGLYRFSLTQLAARLAAPRWPGQRLSADHGARRARRCRRARCSTRTGDGALDVLRAGRRECPDFPARWPERSKSWPSPAMAPPAARRPARGGAGPGGSVRAVRWAVSSGLGG